MRIFAEKSIRLLYVQGSSSWVFVPVPSLSRTRARTRDRDRDRSSISGRDRFPARDRRQPGWLSLHHPERPRCSDRLPACRRRRPGQRQKPTRTRGNPPHRGAGFDIVPERPPGSASPPAQCHTGLPREARSRSALPATRQAAGAPSAWSQPSPSPTSDHADGATLGRWDAKASQRTRRPE